MTLPGGAALNPVGHVGILAGRAAPTPFLGALGFRGGRWGDKRKAARAGPRHARCHPCKILLGWVLLLECPWKAVLGGLAW